MGAALGQVLATAVGVAISPVPIIALILMLFSRSAARNSLAFLLGWLLGLTGIVVVVLALEVGSSDGSGSTRSGVLKVVIGLLFLFLAVRQWRGRPRAGEEPSMPGWMAAIDDLSAIKAIGLGLVLTVANPKNLGLAMATGATISAASLGFADEIVVVAVWITLASITIIAPVAFYLAAGERAEPALTSMKAWLLANNATVMTVLFLVLGAKVLGDGISVLA